MPAKKENHNVEFALLTNEVKHVKTNMAKDNKIIKKDLKEIKTLLDEKYVTKVEFDPIKKLVFGVVGVILVAVATAIMGVILVRGL